MLTNNIIKSIILIIYLLFEFSCSHVERHNKTKNEPKQTCVQIKQSDDFLKLFFLSPNCKLPDSISLNENASIIFISSGVDNFDNHYILSKLEKMLESKKQLSSLSLVNINLKVIPEFINSNLKIGLLDLSDNIDLNIQGDETLSVDTLLLNGCKKQSLDTYKIICQRVKLLGLINVDLDSSDKKQLLNDCKGCILSFE